MAAAEAPPRRQERLRRWTEDPLGLLHHPDPHPAPGHRLRAAVRQLSCRCGSSRSIPWPFSVITFFNFVLRPREHHLAGLLLPPGQGACGTRVGRYVAAVLSLRAPGLPARRDRGPAGLPSHGGGQGVSRCASRCCRPRGHPPLRLVPDERLGEGGWHCALAEPLRPLLPGGDDRRRGVRLVLALLMMATGLLWAWARGAGLLFRRGGHRSRRPDGPHGTAAPVGKRRSCAPIAPRVLSLPAAEPAERPSTSPPGPAHRLARRHLRLDSQHRGGRGPGAARGWWWGSSPASRGIVFLAAPGLRSTTNGPYRNPLLFNSARCCWPWRSPWFLISAAAPGLPAWCWWAIGMPACANELVSGWWGGRRPLPCWAATRCPVTTWPARGIAGRGSPWAVLIAVQALLVTWLPLSTTSGVLTFNVLSATTGLLLQLAITPRRLHPARDGLRWMT